MKKIFLSFLFILLLVPLYAQDEKVDAVSFIKEKKEIKELKKELNNFYNKKEKEYQKRQAELNVILLKIEKKNKESKMIYDKNLAVLKDITGAVQGKTTKIYNSMKAKIAASIFNKMIDEGKIEDVFDIILKLKEKNVTSLLKFINVRYASELTMMLENFKINNELKEK